jgi:hypothetical protein
MRASGERQDAKDQDMRAGDKGGEGDEAADDGHGRICRCWGLTSEPSIDSAHRSWRSGTTQSSEWP